jgi:hypothetical protein
MYTGIGRSLGTSYFRIADQRTREELSYLRRTRDFVDVEVLPAINGCWERAEYPWPLIEKLAKLGGSCSPPQARAWAASPGRRACCFRSPPHAATTSPATTSASPPESTVAPHAATWARCRWPWLVLVCRPLGKGQSVAFCSSCQWRCAKLSPLQRSVIMPSLSMRTASETLSTRSLPVGSYTRSEPGSTSGPRS